MDSGHALRRVASAIRVGAYEDPVFQLGLVLHALGMAVLPRVGVPNALAQDVFDGNPCAFLPGVGRPLTEGEEELFERLVAHLERGAAVEQCLGYTFVRGVQVLTPPDVLAPGPEAESFIDLALRFVPSDVECDIVDVCTGSGVLGLLLARERPRARIHCLDIDARTLGVAAQNQSLLGCANVHLLRSDLYAALPVTLETRCTMIVANPPYCSSKKLRTLPPWLWYAPTRAIDGGADGLSLLRRVIAGAPRYLVNGGTLVLQHAPGQDAAVAGMCDAARFVRVTKHRNVFGEYRFVIAQ